MGDYAMGVSYGAMDRREFLWALGGGAALGGEALAQTRPSRPATVKNWAWLRGDISSMDEWKRSLARMKGFGIDAVLVGGSADLLRRASPAAAAEGLELHAWIFTLMRGEHAAAHPEWYAVSRKGVSTAVKPPYVNYYKFMCPSRDEVRQAIRSTIRDLAAVDGLTAVHLDYIRYPDVILPIALWPKYNLVQDREYPEFDFCYCGVCRERFRKQSGIDPLTLDDPPASTAWLQYRYDTITQVVREVAAEAHAAGKLVTAAVFPTPAIAKRLVRQEWTKWDVDALLPMIYNGFYKEDVAWIERATREGVTALAGRTPLYAGLYVPDLPPADLARAAERAFAGGAHGISLFQGHTLTPEHWSALAPVLAANRTTA
jgi:uncharacterized lipoprotein YddW (UPF0748 family)